MPSTPKPTRPTRAVEVDDHRARLLALRDRLTSQIETAPVAYVAALARQLQSVLGALAELPATASGPVAQLKAAQVARLEAAGIPLPPTRRPGGGG